MNTGEGSYEDFFNNKNATMRGEASPRYFPDREVAERIKQYNPDSKIIILVRNPVNRAYSHYLYNVGSFKEQRIFGDVIRDDYDKFREGNTLYDNTIRLGMYSKFIPIWINLFGKDNVLILSYEKFFTNVQREILPIFDFLGMPPPANTDYTTIYNKTKIVKHVGCFGIVMNSRLRWMRRITPQFLRNSVAKFILNNASAPIMDEKDQKFLEDVYMHEIAMLDHYF